MHKDINFKTDRPVIHHTAIALRLYSAFFAFFYLFSGCGIQNINQQSFDLSVLPTNFPACFSIRAGLSVRRVAQIFRYRMVCSVVYDQRIHFIVKGPFGIELIRGVIDRKGIILLDRLHHTIHQWDYKRIKQHYNFDYDYLFIQSVLLGTVCNPLKDKKPLIPDALSSRLTFDKVTGKVIGLQLIDPTQRNQLKVSYQHKMIAGKLYLASVKIFFALQDKDKKQLYKGSATLHTFRFKPLKKGNIQLSIPAYYRRK